MLVPKVLHGDSLIVPDLVGECINRVRAEIRKIVLSSDVMKEAPRRLVILVCL